MYKVKRERGGLPNVLKINFDTYEKAKCSVRKYLTMKGKSRNLNENGFTVAKM